ncbi:MAG: hypothetical protein ACI9H6_000129 [Patiriisocius sp.]|jgi:hypothetical protein
MKKFTYNLPNGWETMTVKIGGKKVLRYGRMKQRGYEHNAENAPLRADGALYDRNNLLLQIKPQGTAQQASLGKKSKTMLQKSLNQRVADLRGTLDPRPGFGLHADI